MKIYPVPLSHTSTVAGLQAPALTQVTNTDSLCLCHLRVPVPFVFQMEGLKENKDKYAIVESYYILAQAYGHVPDLYVMWMLHLCEAHQEMRQWAEAAQCAVSVAGVVVRVSEGATGVHISNIHGVGAPPAVEALG